MSFRLSGHQLPVSCRGICTRVIGMKLSLLSRTAVAYTSLRGVDQWEKGRRTKARERDIACVFEHEKEELWKKVVNEPLSASPEISTRRAGFEL